MEQRTAADTPLAETQETAEASERRLTLTVRESPGAVVVEAAGEIDLANVEQFRRALVGAAKGLPVDRRVIADLRGLHYMDSAGYGAVFEACVPLARTQRRLTVVLEPDGQARRVFDLMGMGAAVTLAEDLPEGLGANGTTP